MATARSEPAYRTEAPIAADIDAYLETHQHESLLRFITCGSVNDGKSTLIGRLLYDSRMIFEDQLAALEADSRRVGTQVGAREPGDRSRPGRLDGAQETRGLLLSGLLRFTTAGSVDDGKSTLIGRLLYDSLTVYEDQLAGIRKANKAHGGLDL